jgi:hypothetical protein
MENYGNGPSTGLDQTALGKILTGFTAADLSMSNDDKKILRDLAAKVAEIAASPEMKEARTLWQQTGGGVRAQSHCLGSGRRYGPYRRNWQCFGCLFRNPYHSDP